MMASFHSPKADSSTTSTVSPSSHSSSSSSSSSSLLQLESQSSSTVPQKMNDLPVSGSVSIHSKLSHSDSNLFGRFCSSLNLISKKKSMTLDNRHAKNKKNKSGSSTLSSAALKKPKICQKLFDDNGEDDDVVVVVINEDSLKKSDLNNSDAKPIGTAATCLNSSLSSGDKRQTRTTKSSSSSKSPSSSSWLHSSISFINCCITRTDSVSDIGKIQTNGLTKSGAKCQKSTPVPCSSASSSKQPLNKKNLNQRQIPMKLFVNYDLPCSSSSSSSSSQSLSSTPPIPVPQSLASVQSSPAQSKQLISSPNNLTSCKTACVVSDRSRSLSPSAFCSTLNTSSLGSTMCSASGSSRQPFRRNHHNNNSELELLDQTSVIQADELQNRDIGDEDMPIAAIEEHFRKFILEFNAHRTVSNPNGDNSGLQVPSSSSGMGGFISGQYPYRILNPSMNISNPVNNNDDKDINNSQQSASSAHTDGNMPKNFAELDRQSDQSHKRYKNSIHTQIDYANCLVPDLLAISNCSFYWGKMDRYEAERLLENKPEGTFLLRDSAQEDHLFSVSFRRFDRSLHARIEQWKHRFSFDSHDPGVYSSTTVTGLIEHYKDPSHCMFFEPMLTRPLNRTEPFSLQHLARVTISDRCTYETVNQLPIPIVLKCYLKEYHYRQKVRTKHFDEITYLDDFYYN